MWDNFSPQDATSSPLPADTRVASYFRDDVGRLERVVDPAGNELRVLYHRYSYLPRHLKILGQLEDLPRAAFDGLASDPGTIVLEETEFTFDNLDRLAQLDEYFFDPYTGGPGTPRAGDGKRTTAFEYLDNSLLAEVTNDALDAWTYRYDGVHRLVESTYPDDSATTYGYDANSNLTNVTEVEAHPFGPDETYETRINYDDWNRAVEAWDMTTIERLATILYDGAGRPATVVDGRGNRTHHVYDLAGRLIKSAHSMTETGTGGGTFIEYITTQNEYDLYSRLVRQIDPNGNPTEYRFTAHRLDEIAHADGGLYRVLAYNAHGEPETVTDPNGSSITNEFDQLGRVVARTVLPGLGVEGYGDTLLETYRYDGLSGLVYAQDSDSRIERQYDSLSNLMRETQVRRDPATGQDIGTPYVIDYAHDELGNETLAEYPGGRQIEAHFDALGRLSEIGELAGGGAFDLIARNRFVGPGGRLVRREFSNGLQTAYTYSDRREPTGTSVSPIGQQSPILARLATAWDITGNKTARANYEDSATEVLGLAMSYDSLDRMRAITPSALGVPMAELNYDLDSAGNRGTVTEGGTDALAYALLQSPPAQVHEIDSVLNLLTTAARNFSHDNNGNRTLLVGTHNGDDRYEDQYTYDYQDQLVSFAHVSLHPDYDPSRTAAYRYDAIGRRIASVVDGTETRFVYDGDRVIEERDAADTVVRSFVYGSYIDDPIAMRIEIPEPDRDLDYYYHLDDQYSVVMLSDDAGTVSERVRYGTWGAPRFVDVSTGTESLVSAIGNPYAFTGRRWDAAMGLYHYRMRAFDPSVGRFLQRDPIGIWGDAINLGNGYTYTGNNPWSYTDPWGLEGASCFAGVKDWSYGVVADAGSWAVTAGGKAVDFGLVAGEQVGRKTNASLGTIIGLAHGGAGTFYGFGLSTVTDYPTPRISIGNNAIQFENNPFMFKDTAITWGNAIVYSPQAPPESLLPFRYDRFPWTYHMPLIGHHERAHTYQWEIYGPVFPVAYLVDVSRHGWSHSRFEKKADDYANYLATISAGGEFEFEPPPVNPVPSFCSVTFE